MVKITKRQADILRLWYWYQTERGRPPKVKEVMAAMGFRSQNSVTQYLGKLVGMGLITREDGGRASGIYRLAGVRMRAEFDDSSVGVELKQLIGGES